MALVLLAAPAAEPVSLTEAKAWLRIDGTDDDALLPFLITAARQMVESQGRLRLISQTWRWLFDTWPENSVLRPPVGPLRSVDAVRVRDAGGSATALPTTAWQADIASTRGRIALLETLPVPGQALNGIEVDMTAGLAANSAALPAALRQAVLLTLAFLYENRGDATEGLPLPAAAAALVAPWSEARL